MTKLLNIQSSMFQAGGQTSQLAAKYIERWKANNPEGEVVQRNLAADPVPHLSLDRFQAFNTPADQRTPDQQAIVDFSDKLIEEISSADALVLGVPMYNFTIPSTLHTYFDHIARAGITFRYTENGPEGLLKNKKAIIFVARGATTVTTMHKAHFCGNSSDLWASLMLSLFTPKGLPLVKRQKRKPPLRQMNVLLNLLKRRILLN
ncbi:FMN-dependent NADH-azoreductase [Microbulbifer variabilis]|uniref:FMN-dependent NADH-azoreductase n=1 Tax=Microbulbifer variabilis TaxID=266805 RepID=UPI003F4A1749